MADSGRGVERRVSARGRELLTLGRGAELGPARTDASERVRGGRAAPGAAWLIAVVESSRVRAVRKSPQAAVALQLERVAQPSRRRLGRCRTGCGIRLENVEYANPSDPRRWSRCVLLNRGNRRIRAATCPSRWRPSRAFGAGGVRRRHAHSRFLTSFLGLDASMVTAPAVVRVARAGAPRHLGGAAHACGGGVVMDEASRRLGGRRRSPWRDRAEMRASFSRRRPRHRPYPRAWVGVAGPRRRRLRRLFNEPLLLDAFRVRLCTWRLPDRLLPRRRSCALQCAVLRSLRSSVMIP